MILTTEQIIKLLDDLEEKIGCDLDNVKYEVLNNLISYEKINNVLLANNELKEFKNKVITVNGETMEDIYKIEYNKNNRYFMLVDSNNNITKARSKDVSIDFEISITDLIKKINA